MALSKQELQSEKLYLNDTLSLISTHLAEYKDNIDNLAQEMDDTIKYVWENISNMDSAEKSFFNQTLCFSNNIGSMKLSRYKILKEMHDSPLDFTYENGAN